jgi:dihydrofolate reductase
MLIRTHVGTSLDGFVATPDGLPAWDRVPTFVPGQSHGYPEIIEQCDAIAMGRTSFDQGFEDWLGNWPWPNKQVYVLSSRALPANVPAGVFRPALAWRARTALAENDPWNVSILLSLVRQPSRGPGPSLQGLSRTQPSGGQAPNLKPEEA